MSQLQLLSFYNKMIHNMKINIKLEWGNFLGDYKSIRNKTESSVINKKKYFIFKITEL